MYFYVSLSNIWNNPSFTIGIHSPFNGKLSIRRIFNCLLQLRITWLHSLDSRILGVFLFACQPLWEPVGKAILTVLVILRWSLLSLVCFSLLRLPLVFLSNSLLFLLLKFLLLILLEALYLLHLFFRISIQTIKRILLLHDLIRVFLVVNVRNVWGLEPTTRTAATSFTSTLTTSRNFRVVHMPGGINKRLRIALNIAIRIHPTGIALHTIGARELIRQWIVPACSIVQQPALAIEQLIGIVVRRGHRAPGKALRSIGQEQFHRAYCPSARKCDGRAALQIGDQIGERRPDLFSDSLPIDKVIVGCARRTAGEHGLRHPKVNRAGVPVGRHRAGEHQIALVVVEQILIN